MSPISAYSTNVEASMLQVIGPYRKQASGELRVEESTLQFHQSWIDSKSLGIQSWGVMPDDIEDWGDSADETLIASEHVLARDWDTPEEDEAWADL